MAWSVNNEEAGQLQVDLQSFLDFLDVAFDVSSWEVGGSNLLGNASSFSGLNVCLPQLVENQGLTCIDVSQDTDDRTSHFGLLLCLLSSLLLNLLESLTVLLLSLLSSCLGISSLFSTEDISALFLRSLFLGFTLFLRLLSSLCSFLRLLSHKVNLIFILILQNQRGVFGDFHLISDLINVGILPIVDNVFLRLLFFLLLNYFPTFVTFNDRIGVYLLVFLIYSSCLLALLLRLLLIFVLLLVPVLLDLRHFLNLSLIVLLISLVSISTSQSDSLHFLLLGPLLFGHISALSLHLLNFSPLISFLPVSSFLGGSLLFLFSSLLSLFGFPLLTLKSFLFSLSIIKLLLPGQSHSSSCIPSSTLSFLSLTSCWRLSSVRSCWGINLLFSYLFSLLLFLLLLFEFLLLCFGQFLLLFTWSGRVNVV